MKKSYLVFILMVSLSVLVFPGYGQNDDNPQALRDQHRLLQNNPGEIVDLGVGIWAIPFPVDWDGDGDNDLLVSTSAFPYNGMFYFENNGKGIFEPAKRIADGKKNVMPSYVDGNLHVLEPGKIHKDFKNSLYGNPEEIPYKQEFYAGRANQWRLVDYDGDNVLDLVVGASDWREYGWDNAYDSQGKWTNGPLHGYVYWIKNSGTNDEPKYEKAEQVQADGKPVDVYGCPSPNFVDWDGDGDLDLICGEFLDRITYFKNTGSRKKPKYAKGVFLKAGSKTIHMELEMLQVVVFDWDGDKDLDIIVGQEDGRVAWIENRSNGKKGEPALREPVFFKQKSHYLKCGGLVTPCPYDWDGDGDQDLICGNTAGYIEFIENLVDGAHPQWAAPVRLKADGKAIRFMAGENLSIQGPAEAKWGYTVPYVADWDNDGLPDILVNTIIGKIVWFKNIGTRSEPKLAAAKPVEVNWGPRIPKPEWNWWNPEEKELVVQWRTRPVVKDLNQDGLNDLIAVDHEGYLCYFQRARITRTVDGQSVKEAGNLLPGIRVFLKEDGTPLQLNDGTGGKSGRRKIDLVDWDNDGDLDILINSPRESPAKSRNISYYENIAGSGRFMYRYKGDITNVQLEGHTTSPASVDWDKDGVADLLVGSEDGFFYYFKRDSSKEMLGAE